MVEEHRCERAGYSDAPPLPQKLTPFYWHAAAVSVVIIYRKQRAEIKAGSEAARSRHWGRTKQAPPDPRGFLASPKAPPDPPFFENPLRRDVGDNSLGLFSIREDAQEVQRNASNASNHSNTSRDSLLPRSQANAGDGSPQHGAGTEHWSTYCRPDTLAACSFDWSAGIAFRAPSERM